MQPNDAEEFILSHAATPLYDPVKAHAYYLRTRELKGKRIGVAPGPTKPLRKLSDIKDEITDTIFVNGKKIHDPSVPIVPKISISQQRQAEVKTRVTALKGKLNILHAILNKLVAEAQGASAPAAKATTTKSTRSTKSTTSGASTSTSTDSKPRKALTGAEKADKAKKARDKYAQEHPEAAKKATERKQKIAQVKQLIADTNAQLKDAIQSARQAATKSQSK